MPHPLLYEINTRCWLRALSDQSGKSVQLQDVPEATIDQWQQSGFTHVWLMGVWTTGSCAKQLAREHRNLRRRYDEILPGWQPDDVAGSPYAIGDYRVPDALGGTAGLAAFRERLHARGLKLILDFVPNHLGIDHSWVREHPTRFVQATADAEGGFATETPDGPVWLAHGRDPHFPSWSDTVQLDYRRQETRQAVTRLLAEVADQCDGVRCDMAILLLNEVFTRTWESHPSDEPSPKEEYWSEATEAVRRKHPDFLFLAESYWNLESSLQSLGFDYTYDKVLTDLLVERKADQIAGHVGGFADGALERCAHFLENHDEPRIASRLNLAEHRAAALLFLALPGMRLIYDGQLEGRTIHSPVQLGRLPAEDANEEISTMYRELLDVLRRTAVGTGAAALPKIEGWRDNSTFQYIIAVQWHPPGNNQFDLAVVNLAPHRSQGRVRLAVPHLESRDWSLRDLLGEESHDRAGRELHSAGLHLDLAPHAAQLFQFTLRRPQRVSPS